MKPINSVLTIGASLLLLAFGQPQALAYVHPGAPLSLSDLQALKGKVDANQEPWKSGYAALVADGHSQLPYTMRGPFAQVGRNPDVNRTQWDSDMNAIWNLSLMWNFTGDTAYAQKAHDILLAWANTQTSFTGGESMLELGDYAYKFVGAADILRGTWPGWTAADTTAVKAYFGNVLMPATNPYGESMFGAANKGALSLCAKGLMAIFNDDATTLDTVVYQIRTLAHIGLRSSNDIGQIGDSGRDQGHAYGQLLSLTMLAEALWKQGIDVYSDYNNRLLAAGEYFARVNNLTPTPFLPFGSTDNYYPTPWFTDQITGGNLGLSILQGAYVVRKGLPAPCIAQRLQDMPVDEASFVFLKDADSSTATPAAALAIPATTSITSGFTDVEIGGASPTGNSSYSGGTWTVVGSGTNIWGATGDTCHFTYQAVTGDCAIIAKVESVQNTHASARAGVMIRTSLSQGAPRAWMAVTPSIHFEQNIEGLSVYGGINYSNKSYSIPSASYWVKLERIGNIVTGYVSPDGTNWAATDVGRLDNPPATWYVGLVVDSVNGALNTSTFSNVQITGGNGGAPIVTPAAPAALLAASGENAVSLRWQPSFGATSYTIKRATTSGGTYSTVASGITASNYTDATGTNGTTYYYVVNAVNSAGTSANSPEDSATPISPMVNVAFGGTATVSAGTVNGQGAAQAFDASATTKWFDGAGSTGWVQYDFGSGNAQTIKRYTLTSADDMPDRDPKNWQFQGSNDGSTWTTLDTQSNQAFAARYQTNIYSITSPASYRYYRLNVTANNGNTTSLQLAELGLWSDTGRTVPNGTYRVINKNSRKALDVYNNGTADNTNVDQWSWNGGNNQKWTLTYLGNGQYNAMGVGSGKLLEVLASSTANGANIEIWSSTNTNRQKWTLTPVGNGNYKFLNGVSGKAAEVSGGSTADGANVQQWSYSGSDNQLWQISIAP
ncbi:MAG: RICIN domain-containing protein [Verrucomicrobia bacterium]|nr:RICIN domain-containing protein [Verrucomicrobiota bacterium]